MSGTGSWLLSWLRRWMMKLQLRWMWWMFSFRDVTFWLLPSGPNLCLAAKSLTLSCQKCSEMVSFGGWRVPASRAVNNLTLSFCYKNYKHAETWPHHDIYQQSENDSPEPGKLKAGLLGPGHLVPGTYPYIYICPASGKCKAPLL